MLVVITCKTSSIKNMCMPWHQYEIGYATELLLKSNQLQSRKSAICFQKCLLGKDILLELLRYF